MTEETDKQTDLLLEADWRLTLPEAFRPVAERYGKHKFAIAYNCGAAQEGLERIMKRVNNNMELAKVTQMVAGALNQLASYALEAQKMTSTELITIQQDIMRASMLQQAAPNPGGKIIVAS